jgi:hypothetical protein
MKANLGFGAVLIAVLYGSAAFCFADDASSEGAEQSQAVKNAAAELLDTPLRYDGKSFDQWRAVLRTELSAARQTDALVALGAFAANGRSKDAAAAIAEFIAKPSRLPAEAKARDALVQTAVAAIGRGSKADFEAISGRETPSPVDLTAEFWQKARAQFAIYHKSYLVDELVQRDEEPAGHSTDLSQLVAELKASFPAETWHDDGGECDILPFHTNLTIVVSAPKSVHQAMDRVLANMRQTHSLTRTYPIRHLVRPVGESIAAAKKDLDALIELIASTVQPTSWTAGGGSGVIRQNPANMTLVVSGQPRATHREIESLLLQIGAQTNRRPLAPTIPVVPDDTLLK